MSTSHRSHHAILIGVVTALSVLVAAPVVNAGDVGLDGRSDGDRQLEVFLASAEVVADEPLGTGVTGARKLTLRLDGVERTAVFKTVDIQSTEVVHTNRFEATFRDCYLFEVAAYRLDRLLGIGLVPVTVLREVDGERGSIQAWVSGVMNLREMFEHPEVAAAGNPIVLQRCLTSMYVLDALISNVDRNWDNVLVNPGEDRFALIDHSRSFRMNSKVEPPLSQNGVIPLTPAMAERLQAVDDDVLDDTVGDLLSRAQMRCLKKRYRSLLETLAENGLLPDDRA